MERTGPEALMLTAAIAGQRELDQFARCEYSLADAPRVAASLLRDFEAMPAQRSLAQGMRRWGAKLLRRGGAGAGTVGSKAAEGVAETAARRRVVLAPSLASLPALDTGRGERVPPLSVVPRAGRA
jgi:hypothetical protein